MSLKLQLRIVGQAFSFFLLRVFQHATIVQLFDDVVLNVCLVELWMALHAKHLFTNAEHFKLYALRSGIMGGLWWQLCHKVTVAL